MPEINDERLDIFRIYLNKGYDSFMSWPIFLEKYRSGEIEAECESGAGEHG